MATFGLSKYFEVHNLSLGAVQTMQWKPSIDPALAFHHVGNMKAAIWSALQHRLSKSQPVCFAHEGFAVAGAASGNSVYVWDAECGDELLSLDHGGEFPKSKKNSTEKYHRGFKSTHTSGALNVVRCKATYAYLAV